MIHPASPRKVLQLDLLTLAVQESSEAELKVLRELAGLYFERQTPEPELPQSEWIPPEA